jgi:hypothetical protein
MFECEACLKQVNNFLMLPSGFTIEAYEDEKIIIQPLDQSAYRNICFSCIGLSK